MSEQAISADICNATLVSRHDFTSELSIVRIQPDSGVIREFTPGQFIKLGLPRGEQEPSVAALAGRVRSSPRLIRRAYSIASSPRDRDSIELIVVRVERGKLTPRLWMMEPGSRVWMDDQIGGNFTLDPIPPGRDVVMVATGTGIAPFMSMLRTWVHEPPWHRVVVINGVRCAADLGYRQELELMAATCPNTHYIPIVSREPAGNKWQGLRGRVQHVLDPRVYQTLVQAPLDLSHGHVMLCGNPDMIVSVQVLLEQRGFHTHSPTQPGNIHFERYW